MSVQWIFLFLQSGGTLYVICNYWAVACIIHSVLKKSKETADQAVNDAIVPGVMNTLFDDVQMHPEGHLLDVKGSNIPLQTYSYLNSNGNICFRYQGHPAELCSITLTDVTILMRTTICGRQMSRRFTGDSGCAVNLGRHFLPVLHSGREANWIKSSEQKRLKPGMKLLINGLISAVIMRSG